MNRKRNIRPHHKTKTGCSECRERKIKCDERKPVCRHCARRSSKCTYPHAIVSVASSPGSNGPLVDASVSHDTSLQRFSPITPFNFNSGVNHNVDTTLLTLNILHIELLHQWYTSTCHTITYMPELKIIWQVHVPQIGLKHNYVLQTLLALSARHLARLKPTQKDDYESIAITLHSAALESLSMILPNVSEENSTAVFLCSAFTLINCLAVPNKPNEIPPLAQTEDTADWLVLLRGIVYVWDTAWSWLLKGLVSPLFHLALNNLQPAGKVSQAEEHLVRVRNLIERSISDDKHLAVYFAALDDLRHSFFTYGSHTAEDCLLPVVFAWPSRLSDEYVVLLGQREQEALVIFCFFAVLFSRVSNKFWWLEGWPEHIISKAHGMLDTYHRLWIRWPMDEIGWSPGPNYN